MWGWHLVVIADFYKNPIIDKPVDQLESQHPAASDSLFLLVASTAVPSSDVASQCAWACMEVARATPECVVAALFYTLERLTTCNASVPAPLSCLSSAIVDKTVCSQAFSTTGNIYLPHNLTDSLTHIHPNRHLHTYYLCVPLYTHDQSTLWSK